MATLAPPLLLLLLAVAITARSQSTSFTYDFYGDQPSDLLYQGDAHFPSDSTYLRMTKTSTSGAAQTFSVGRVVYPTPVKFWEAGAQVDFETTLKFIINPNAGDSNPADGFAFFISPVGSPIGFTGGCFGVFNSSGAATAAFAAEFDVFVNNGVDPSYRHVGIDIESNVSKNVTAVDALLGQEVTARVSYQEATKLITVSVAAGGKTYEVSYVFDLSGVLTQEVQVGVAGATGGQVAVHDLISWYFTSNRLFKCVHL